MTKIVEDYINITEKYCSGQIQEKEWKEFLLKNKEELISHKDEVDEYIKLNQPKS